MRTTYREYTIVEACKNCYGQGKVRRLSGKAFIRECDICAGTGKVSITRKVTTEIEPFQYNEDFLHEV